MSISKNTSTPYGEQANKINEICGTITVVENVALQSTITDWKKNCSKTRHAHKSTHNCVRGILKAIFCHSKCPSKITRNVVVTRF